MQRLTILWMIFVNWSKQVRFPPQSAKYKIYIIDEVHMLSTAAFNAFLKTLKSLRLTVSSFWPLLKSTKFFQPYSRVVRFLISMSIDSIVNHLHSIATKENIEAERSALHIMAEKCDEESRCIIDVRPFGKFRRRKTHLHIGIGKPERIGLWLLLS